MKRQKTEYRIQKSIPPIRPLPREAGLRNEKGIALVLVMILSLIALAFVSAMLFMVTQGTILSGAYKVYKSAEDASFGGTGVIQDYMLGRGNLSLPLLGINTGGSCTCDTHSDGNATTNDNIDNALSPPARSCRCDKICSGHFNGATNNWTTGADAKCTAADTSLDPMTNSDIQLTLGGGYQVFGKIVDTVEGNSDMGGLVTGGGTLGGGGVVSSNTGLVNPPQSPYIYRIEAQAQNTTNPAEQSRLSILYAY
jgi:hypothetical protein